MRRFLPAMFVLGLALLVPSGAGAATQIGNTFEPDAGCSPLTRLQSVSPANQYAAPSNGVITRWSFRAASNPPDLRFKVGRVTPGEDLTTTAEFTIVGETLVMTDLREDALNSFFTRIPVLTGDVIGFFNPDFAGPCNRDIDPKSNPLTDQYVTHNRFDDPHPGDRDDYFRATRQLDISATLEADCDNDGLGDETQDPNIASCGPAAVAAQAALSCKGERPTIVGTNGNDFLLGTPGRDVIQGLAGNDTVFALDGNDVICGNAGKDKLRGQDGDDAIKGNDGADSLKGGRGDDNLRGGRGPDVLKGERGDDRLGGGKGNDTCRPGKGSNTLHSC